MTSKNHPSYQDVLAKLRRVLIAAQYRADQPPEPTPQEIQTIRLAWPGPAPRRDREARGRAAVEMFEQKVDRRA